MSDYIFLFDICQNPVVLINCNDFKLKILTKDHAINYSREPVTHLLRTIPSCTRLNRKKHKLGRGSQR